jgi:hypothetical protein
MKTLFAFDSWRIEVLDSDDVAARQRFFDANPEYFVTVNGEGPLGAATPADYLAMVERDRPGTP